MCLGDGTNLRSSVAMRSGVFSLYEGEECHALRNPRLSLEKSWPGPPSPKPSSFPPKPVVSRAPRVVAGIGFTSFHSIAVFRPRGEGLKRRRMSRGWRSERTPALLPEDPRLRSRSGGRASSQAPETNASARAQSRPSSRRPAPRVSVPAPRTPYSQGASLFAHPTCASGFSRSG